MVKAIPPQPVSSEDIEFMRAGLEKLEEEWISCIEESR